MVRQAGRLSPLSAAPPLRGHQRRLHGPPGPPAGGHAAVLQVPRRALRAPQLLRGECSPGPPGSPRPSEALLGVLFPYTHGAAHSPPTPSIAPFRGAAQREDVCGFGSDTGGTPVPCTASPNRAMSGSGGVLVANPSQNRSDSVAALCPGSSLNVYFPSGAKLMLSVLKANSGHQQWEVGSHYCSFSFGKERACCSPLGYFSDVFHVVSSIVVSQLFSSPAGKQGLLR